MDDDSFKFSLHFSLSGLNDGSDFNDGICKGDGNTWGNFIRDNEESNTEEEQCRFFSWRPLQLHHCEKVVEAASAWSKSIQYTTCSYESGIELEWQEKKEKSDISSLPYAKKHLQQDYGELWQLYLDTEKESFRLSNEIKELMTAKYKPSFQKTIEDRISAEQLQLKKTDEWNLEPHTYNRYVFAVIFKDIQQILEGGTPQKLAREADGELWVLRRGGVYLAKGKKVDIDRLEEVILELENDRGVRGIIEKYNGLYSDLTNTERLNRFANGIQELKDLVDNGKLLAYEGKVCDGCHDITFS